MKKILTLFAVVGLIVFTGCEGPEGPPGQDGVNIVGTVYENTSANYYNFTEGNNYSVVFNFPQQLIISDVVLVYRLGDVVNGQPLWEFLPETHYFDDEAGIRDFTYNFNFTRNYTKIFLEGYDPSNPVPSQFTSNQIFRIVVVPADFASKVDKSNYLDVANKLNLKESQVQDIKF
ncbi:hypothetical protein [Flavobacterium soyae]|uniref:hypothetical protein n=1 Tax=Flavobacterium soyae TaxID=2903098 RepID=UPI001E4A0F86|nr:hypothetical protein [Flavobacterium soyae]MCD9575713.1 hypothetical protein [Flavobacterium soyae]